MHDACDRLAPIALERRSHNAKTRTGKWITTSSGAFICEASDLGGMSCFAQRASSCASAV
jgi:hypothetical protein